MRSIAARTQALFEGGAAYPVGFSVVSAILTILCVVPVFLIDKSQWAVPKQEKMKGAPPPLQSGRLCC